MNKQSKKPSLLETHPDIAKQWHPTKNGDLTPNQVTAGSHKIVWWKCSLGNDHQWRSEIRRRVKGTNCQICNKRTVATSNSLSKTHPDIANQWHPTKNGDLTPDLITAISRKRISWICKKRHEWQAVVRDRTSKNTRCPYCAGKKPSVENNLTVTHPDLVKQWHPTKN
jgi:hypothetical protein